jgi:hypothetical protein
VRLGPVGRAAASKFRRRPCTSTGVVEAPVADEFAAVRQLSDLSGASGPSRVGTTRLGRGLLATGDVGETERQVLVDVPVHNCIVITDNAVEGLSIFGDRQQRKWQEQHVPLPDELQEFLQSGSSGASMPAGSHASMR